MSKVIDKVFLELIRSELNDALKKIGKKYDITLATDSARIKDGHGNISIHIYPEDINPVQEDWNKWIQHTGLLPEDLGKKVKLNGKTYRIVGRKPRARINSIRIDDVESNKHYVTSVASILVALGRMQRPETKPIDQGEAMFRSKAGMIGFKLAEYGDEFEYKNDTIRIVGINVNAKHYPIYGKNLRTGAHMKFSPNFFKEHPIQR